jgi:hypothetical protein
LKIGSPEKRVPAEHPLRPIRKIVDEILKEMSPKFQKLYSDDHMIGLLSVGGSMKTLVVSCMLFALLVNVSAAQAQSGQRGQAQTNKVSAVVSRVTKVKGLRLVSTASLQAPPDAFCLDNFGIPCYSPQQIQTAYGLTPILGLPVPGRRSSLSIRSVAPPSRMI